MKRRARLLWICSLAFLLAVVAGIIWRHARRRPSFDLLIRNGLVMDPGLAAPKVADIGIAEGKVAAVAILGSAGAKQVLDATGLVVAPGFIDTHTHIEGGVALYGAGRTVPAENFLRQGVTTVITGNCGRSALSLSNFFAELSGRGIAPNVASLVGQGSIRRRVLSEDARPPTASELAEMERLVEEAMRDGALGLSTGLEYAPGAFAQEAELAALARVAASAGGLFAVHLRTEANGIDEALEEALRVSEQAGIWLHVSHLKPVGPRNSGRASPLLARLEEQRRRGARITQDLYPYTASSTDLSVLFSKSLLAEGLGRVGQRLSDSRFRERVRKDLLETVRGQGWSDLSFAQVAYFSPQPRWNGLYLPHIARELASGADGLEAQAEAVIHLLARGGAQMIYHNISEADSDTVFASPWTMVGSDSNIRHLALGHPHPRGSGSFPRFLRRYGREKKLLGFAEAIRRITRLPAETFGLAGRGCLQVGCWADVVILDPQRLSDLASYELPLVPPNGIRYVLVNGVVTVDERGMTGQIAGKVLRRQTR